MRFGCSSFSWETLDGCHLLGRTYDQFGDLAANRVIGVPAGHPCPLGLKEEEGPSGRYGYTGMAVLGFGAPVLVDGVNTAGLMGALLHYPEWAAYRQEPDRRPVHPGRLLAWLLSRCASVEAALAALEEVTLVDEPIQGKPLPAHYILSDRTGEAVVLEPEAEGIQVYRHTIGVLTNSPGYLWHHRRLGGAGAGRAAGRRLRPAGGLLLPLPLRPHGLHKGLRRPGPPGGGRGLPDVPGLCPGGYPRGAGQGRPRLRGL